MEKCLLCKTNDADRKGSHIVPHFLIQSMYNADGEKGRDKEVSMEIGAFSIGLYFGRSVSVDKINSVLGRELKDEEIEGQSNPFVLDFIFCNKCENRLGKIESIYSKESQKLQHLDSNFYLNGCTSLTATLFWTSVFWRIAVTKIALISANDDLFEFLRILLNEALTEEEKDIEKSVVIHKDKIITISHFLIKPYERKSSTKGVFLISPINETPYTMIINDNVLFFSTTTQFKMQESLVFFGFEKYYSNSGLNPKKNDHELLSIISNEQFDKCLKNISQFKADLYKNELESHFNHIHTKIFNFPAPAYLIKATMDRIILEKKDELTPAQRYNLERITKIFGEELIKLQ